MIYLTGENVFAFNSGTEISQFERLRAFKNNGWPTKLLLRNYNCMLAKDMQDHQLVSSDVLNMYDYFQGTDGVERKEKPLRLLESMALEDYHIVFVDNNTSELRYQGKLIGKVNVMPETVGLVGSIEYFDSLGYNMVKEYWDWRGFLSMLETYHPDGSIASQQFLRLDGSVALEISHMYLGDQVLPTSWKLLDHYGKDYLFDTEDQLYTFFLNEVNAKEPGTFISDRRTLDRCVMDVVNAKAKFAYVHSVPFADLKKKEQGVLPAYRYALGAGDFDRVIFPTRDEADDVGQMFDQVVTAVAPDSFVSPKTEVKTLPKQKMLVYVGRLAQDKQVTDLLKCFKVMHQKDETLRFKLQGYFSSPKYRERLEDLVTKYKLQDVVEFIMYRPDLSIYQEATLFLNTSPSEGFGMNMLESMAYGVPVVSYAISYTENNLVKDGVNGFNVRNKTPKLLAQKALELLESNEEYQKLSKGALKTAKLHDERAFITAWDQLLTAE